MTCPYSLWYKCRKLDYVTMAKNKIIAIVFITAMSSQIDFSKNSSAKRRKLKDNLTLKKSMSFAKNAAN